MRSQAVGLRPHFSLRRIKNILLEKPPSREFAHSALTQRQIKKYVILSASEISHRKSTEHILFTLVVGFFTSFRMTCFSTLPGVCSLGIDAKTVNASEILLLVLYQFEQVAQAVEIVAGEIIYVNSSAIVVAYRRNFRAEIALHALDQIS